MRLFATLNYVLKHPLNRSQPLQAVARFIHWQAISRLRSETVFKWVGGSKLVVRKGMAGATGNIYCGLHEYVDMSFLLHLLRPHDLFLDVGANIGSYTILASAVCGAKSIAIEPDPEAVRYLAKNISVNSVKALCSIAQTAVGEFEGTVSFTVGQDTVNKVQVDEDAPGQIVPLTKLDSLIAGKLPTLIKLDVEGYELSVLKGAENALSCPGLLAIIIENTDPEIVSVLNAFGFHRYFYDPTARTLSRGTEGQKSYNGLFVRDIISATERLQSSRTLTYRGQTI